MSAVTVLLFLTALSSASALYSPSPSSLSLFVFTGADELQSWLIRLFVVFRFAVRIE